MITSVRIEALNQPEDDAAGRPYRSLRGLLGHLATLTGNQVRFAGTVPMRAEPTSTQRQAFDLPDAPIPSRQLPAIRLAPGSGPPRIHDVSGRPHPDHGPQPPRPAPEPAQSHATPATARQRTQPRNHGQPREIFTPNSVPKATKTGG